MRGVVAAAGRGSSREARGRRQRDAGGGGGRGDRMYSFLRQMPNHQVTGLPLDRLRQLCESAGVALPRNFDGSVETLAANLREVAEALQCPGRVVRLQWE